MLTLIKKPILILLLIGAIGGGAYYFSKKQGFVLGDSTANLQNYLETSFPQLGSLVSKLPFNQVENEIEETEISTNSSTFFQDTFSQTSKQLGTLSENGLEVKDQLLKFASEIKESTQSTPLHEKAFEYGQYLYCQQVIKEYENSPQ